MKQAINFRWFDGLLILGFALFFSMGTAAAQARQQAGDCTRFIQCDLNGDGFIAQNEFRQGSFADFDENGDGQLSRQEYRNMNKSQRACKANQGQGKGVNAKGRGNARQNGSMSRGQNRAGGRGRGL